MSGLKSLTHCREGITLAELVPMLATVLLSHPHHRDSSGALLVNYCCVAVPVPLHSPGPSWRLKALPELLSNACSERETTERRQETTDGWQEAAIPK